MADFMYEVANKEYFFRKRSGLLNLFRFEVKLRKLNVNFLIVKQMDLKAFFKKRNMI